MHFFLISHRERELSPLVHIFQISLKSWIKIMHDLTFPFSLRLFPKSTIRIKVRLSYRFYHTTTPDLSSNRDTHECFPHTTHAHTQTHIHAYRGMHTPTHTRSYTHMHPNSPINFPLHSFYMHVDSRTPINR